MEHHDYEKLLPEAEWVEGLRQYYRRQSFREGGIDALIA
jgi:hypothetical protein